jgi:hypothetical protein
MIWQVAATLVEVKWESSFSHRWDAPLPPPVELWKKYLQVLKNYKTYMKWT